MTARVLIAGTGSGAGKTTVASGLIGALTARGDVVQGFKVGPDYIDPSFHALASGRPGRNLDAYLSGPELIAPLFQHGAAGADIAVIEGVMGLFDGASGRGELASSAHVAKLLGAPVLLVVDGSAMARSAGAVVHGFATFDPELNVAGVIFNRVGSDIHAGLLEDAAEAAGIPVVGMLRRNASLKSPERHLGLVPAGERAPALAEMAAAVAAQVDLERVVALARAAPALRGPAWSPVAEPASSSAVEPAWSPDDSGKETVPGGRFLSPSGARGPRIAIARGPAFSFHYEENLELLSAAGAELVPLDPITDPHLPEHTDALILAGGFPEVFGAELAANATLKADVRALAAAHRPILAECGGLLYLGESLDGHAMCGVLASTGQMAGRLTLGYREATVATGTPWLAAGETVRGHEFHYSIVETPAAPAAPRAWQLTANGRTRDDGIVSDSVQAGYLHVHWAAFPQIARRFVAAAAR